MPERNHFIFIRFILLFAFFFLNQSRSSAQITQADSVLKKTEDFVHNILYQSHDTSYIANYSDELALKILGVNKYTYFQVNDKNKNSALRYRPDRQINLGFGVAYKWFAIDVAFNVGIVEDSELENKNFLDFQGRIFSRKQYFEGTFQYYYGYKVNKIKGADTNLPESSNIREDIRTINFVLQYLYAFNYGRFSLKAPFILNEVQKKSAGSLIGGANFSLYIMDADSSVIPPELSDDFTEALHLQDLNVASVGLNIGYMYSFVWKKRLFITLSFIPGFSINMGDSRVVVREPFRTNISLRMRTMNAIGYNGRRFFTGIQVSGNIIKVKIDKRLNVDASHGNSKLFIGYRFSQGK